MTRTPLGLWVAARRLTLVPAPHGKAGRALVAARTPDAHFVLLECIGSQAELVVPAHLLRDAFVRLATSRDVPVLVADDALTDALALAAGISPGAPRRLAAMLAPTAATRILRAHLRVLEATPQDPRQPRLL